MVPSDVVAVVEHGRRSKRVTRLTSRSLFWLARPLLQPKNPLCSAVAERALEHGGVEFIPENGGGPGVRLKKRKTKR